MAKGKYTEWITEEGLIKIEGWSRDGLTNEQIAKNIGINPDTLYTWMKRFPEISEVLKRGKDVADRQVENAMFKSAIGYQYEESHYIAVELDQEEYDLKVQIELDIWNKNNPNATQDERDRFIMSIPRTKEILEKKVVKEVKPDTTAGIFWLKNRKPTVWRDKQDVEHSGNMNVNNAFSELTTEELRKLAAKDD